MAQAAIHLGNGDAKRAAEIYEWVLSRLPDFAPAQKRLAALYLRQPANSDKAYDLATHARKTLPDDPELAEILGEISYGRKEYSRAAQLFDESARKRPLDAKHLFYFGICSAQTKQVDRARKALDQALAAGLEDPLASEAKQTLHDLGKN